MEMNRIVHPSGTASDEPFSLGRKARKMRSMGGILSRSSPSPEGEQRDKMAPGNSSPKMRPLPRKGPRPGKDVPQPIRDGYPNTPPGVRGYPEIMGKASRTCSNPILREKGSIPFIKGPGSPWGLERRVMASRPSGLPDHRSPMVPRGPSRDHTLRQRTGP